MKKLFKAFAIFALGCGLVGGAIVVSAAVLLWHALGTLGVPSLAKILMLWALIVPFIVLLVQACSPRAEARRWAALCLVLIAILVWITASANEHPGFFGQWPSIRRTYNRLEQLITPIKQVDPLKHDWFSARNGAPLLFYSHPTSNRWVFYEGPTTGGCDPETGIKVQPVSLSVRQTWEAQQQDEKAAEEQQREEKKQKTDEAERQVESERAALENLRRQQDVTSAAPSHDCYIRYWMIDVQGREFGPVPAAQLQQWIAEGRANAQTPVFEEGTAGWKPLGCIFPCQAPVIYYRSIAYYARRPHTVGVFPPYP
jgi:hypothetical protein